MIVERSVTLSQVLLKWWNTNFCITSDIDDKLATEGTLTTMLVEEGPLVVVMAARMLHKASAAATSPRASGPRVLYALSWVWPAFLFLEYLFVRILSTGHFRR